MPDNNVQNDVLRLTNLKLEGAVDVPQKDGSVVAELSMTYIGPIPDTCPNCGQKFYKHSSRDIRVLDTPFLGKRTELLISYPRRRCSNCKTLWKGSCPDIDENRSLTKRAFADITNRALNMTFEQVRNDYKLSANTAKNIFVDYMAENESNLRFKTPCFLGIDEIKIKRLGEITVVTDLEHRTLFDMFQGRNQKRLLEYFKALPGTENVTWVCSDMYRPFENTLAATMPNATWVIDHFHVVAKANEALDYIRRQLQSEMKSKKERVKTKKGLAYTLKTRRNMLTTEEAEKIRLLRNHPKLGPLAVAYDLKEDFFCIYDDNPTSKDNAERAFAQWESSIPNDKLFDKFREVAEMVHNHYQAIFARWDCPTAISNGYTECVNRLIRENNLKGRGYSFEVLRGRTLYRKTNLTALTENGLVYGPEIQESMPNFFFESNQEDDNDDLEDDDTFNEGYVDKDTGEILDPGVEEETEDGPIII